MSEPASLREAADRPLVLPTRLHGFRQILDNAMAQQRLRPHIVAEVDSVSVLMESVAHGLAETIQPWSAVHRMAGQLSYSEIAERDLFRPNFLCSLPVELMSPLAAETRNLVIEETRRLVATPGWTGLAERRKA